MIILCISIFYFIIFIKVKKKTQMKQNNNKILFFNNYIDVGVSDCFLNKYLCFNEESTSFNSLLINL